MRDQLAQFRQWAKRPHVRQVAITLCTLSPLMVLISVFFDRSPSMAQGDIPNPPSAQQRPLAQERPIQEGSDSIQIFPESNPFDWERIIGLTPMQAPQQEPIAHAAIPQRLQAIVNGREQRALIDGRLYSTGEMIDSYRIVEISQNAVRLEGPDGFISLSIE